MIRQYQPITVYCAHGSQMKIFFNLWAPRGMDLWGLYSRFRENQQAGEGGFRTDEAENQGAAVDAQLDQ